MFATSAFTTFVARDRADVRARVRDEREEREER